MSDQFVPRPNHCLLFRQDKEGNENRPDYAGEIEVQGTGHFSAALWGRKDKNGKTYLSLRLTKKEPGQRSDDRR
jgi:uncharacterized protein (DUF736 family)